MLWLPSSFCKAQVRSEIPPKGKSYAVGELLGCLLWELPYARPRPTFPHCSNPPHSRSIPCSPHPRNRRIPNAETPPVFSMVAPPLFFLRLERFLPLRHAIADAPCALFHRFPMRIFDPVTSEPLSCPAPPAVVLRRSFLFQLFIPLIVTLWAFFVQRAPILTLSVIVANIPISFFPPHGPCRPHFYFTSGHPLNFTLSNSSPDVSVFVVIRVPPPRYFGFPPPLFP